MTTTQTQEQRPVSALALIKRELLGPAALQMFKDNLPTAIGAEADKIAARFAKMAFTSIIQSPMLQKCTVPSILRSCSISASLGLDIDSRGLVYLVPYLNKKLNPPQYEAQLQVGYLGLIELAYRSGKVRAISAHCIYESEKDSVTITRTNGQWKVEHPFSWKPTSGKIIAVYATATVEGTDPQTCVLRADEVEDYRKCSKAPNSPAWTDFPDAMYKKTAIRQLAKFLPKSILEEFSRAVAADEQETFVQAKQTAEQEIAGQMGSQAIDAAFERPGQPAEAETPADNDPLAD